MKLIWVYLFAGLGAFCLSVALTPLLMAIARRLGMVDMPSARKIHSGAIPRSGGLAMAAAAIPIVIILFFFNANLRGTTTGQHITLLALLSTSIAVLGLGFMDDVLHIPAKYKLVALAIAAASFAGSGQEITDFQLGWYHLHLGLAAMPVTILWLIAVPVSLNFIDGMDGLAGGVAGMAAAVLSIVAISFGAIHVAIISLALTGAIAGFLFFNFNPAKVFMGDAGSMFLGFVLAALGVMGSATSGHSNVILSVAVALSVPLFDTVLTFIRRGILLRRSLFSAERGHIHHRLLDLGLHQRHAVLLLYFASLCSAGAALTLDLAQKRVILLASGLQLCVIVGLFRAAGSARARDTVNALRRNRRIGRDTRHYRAAFEELQTRFKMARDFQTWWKEACAAAEMLDFVSLELPIVSRDGGPRSMEWKNLKPFDSADTVSATVPVAHRRPGGPLRASIEVAAAGLLESAGERVALFTRLMSEFSLASLPDAAEGPPRFSLMSAIAIRSGKPARPVIKARLKLQKYSGDAPFVEEKPLSALKVAIVHDFLYTYAGAERVLEQIIEMFPDADLFSLFDFLPDDLRGFIKNKKVTTTFIQKLPFARRNHRTWLPLYPLAIEQLNLSQYDLVISSSYVAAKGVLTRPDQLHVCYCHSPVRFAWDLQHQYLGEAGIVKGIKSMLARSILHYTRLWDVRSSVGVDVFLSNSLFVGRRIEKVYRRSSTPLYPPVDVDKFTVHAEKEDFYLTASRLVTYKRTALIVEAFNHMPDRRLIVVGDGPELEQIKAMAGPNVRVLGYQTFDRLKLLMQRAKAFVFAAEEDFGIVAVEAQACGTPVIAYGRGGVTETVVQGKTGLFFSEQTPESIGAAVAEFEQRGPWDADVIRAQAEKFSIPMFRGRLMEIVNREWEAFIERRKRNVAAFGVDPTFGLTPPADHDLSEDDPSDSNTPAQVG
ncbi:MAG TPA: glycosyltransferase [Phycisphaerae bacterium]|jgi:UDP-N-acetylmuramyl pentapeptide phosphotransferase/UDP-N-acetylglucosamine-1-phosphate transferase/glycosyltransferase involved in cell wall biosynthesis|nr:glycosyltransferase [Phycisphaerae bacterium]